MDELEKVIEDVVADGSYCQERELCTGLCDNCIARIAQAVREHLEKEGCRKVDADLKCFMCFKVLDSNEPIESTNTLQKVRVMADFHPECFKEYERIKT